MLLGGRCECSLVVESAGENTKMRLRVHLAANLFPVKSAKKKSTKWTKNHNKSVRANTQSGDLKIKSIRTRTNQCQKF